MRRRRLITGSRLGDCFKVSALSFFNLRHHRDVQLPAHTTYLRKMVNESQSWSARRPIIKVSAKPNKLKAHRKERLYD